MRFINKILIIIFIIASFNMALAQGESDYVVSTNRPNQTDAIGVVEPGYMQLEAGIGYTSISDNLLNTDIIFLPSIQFRLGIIKKLELNLFYDYNNLHIVSNTQDEKRTNQFFTIGSKYHLADQNGTVPEISSVLNLHYSSFAGIKDWDWEVRFIFQNTINERFALAYMLRYRNNLAFTLNPSYVINEKWSAFFEYYSDIRFNPDSIEENQNGINLGVGFLVSNRITLDLMYGTVFTEDISNGLVTTGIGWWIK